MEIASSLALWVYEQIPHGIDRILGSTGELVAGEAGTVDVQEGTRWYVRHRDPDIGPAYVEHLAAEVRLRSLPGLSLASCSAVDDRVAGALAGLDHLKTLDLFNTGVGDASLGTLAGALPALTSLNLAGTRVTDEGMRSLARFEALEVLHLGWTDVSDGGLASLSELPALRTIILHGAAVGDAGMVHLARLPMLEAIDVQETAVGDSGVEALLPLAPRLLRLYLGYTLVTDASVANLSRFTRLRTLMLRATRVPASSDAELERALGELGGLATGPGATQEGLIR